MEEDEERREVLKKIVDVLLEGGYFRARISSLSPFDKLTGGLAWCIAASNIDIDIDIDYDLLFYDDEATLGEKMNRGRSGHCQKITLNRKGHSTLTVHSECGELSFESSSQLSDGSVQTIKFVVGCKSVSISRTVGEAIEAALQNMACPYPLQAHQIQGLDYQAVYPVVQWLVRRVLTMREELGDELCRYSHLQFEQNYQLPEEAASKQALQDRLRGLSSVSVLQQPKRLYWQAKNAAMQPNPTDRIHCTLMEYGLDINKEDSPIPSGSSSFGMHKPCKEEKNARRPGSHFTNIRRSDLALLEVDDGFLTRSKICQLFDSCGVEIQSAFSNYTLSHDDHGAWKQKVAALLKKTEKLEICIEQYKSDLSKAKSALEILDRSMKDQDQKFGRLKTELNHFNEKVEKEGVTSIVETLISLLQKLKSLEKEDSDFHKQTSEQMQDEILKLTTQILKSDENDEYPKLEITLNDEILKLEARRIELAKEHRTVALLQRRLDDIPTQTELVQFEHRFVELYEHIQARLRETRRYYGTYNALAEANELTLKETSLLSSINSQFEGAMVSAPGRAKLIESMEGIDKGIQQKLGKVKTRFEAEKSKCNVLKEKYGALVAEQRHYSSLLKSFQDECARNEKLQMDLNGLNALLS